jgi:hypothetical protein
MFLSFLHLDKGIGSFSYFGPGIEQTWLSVVIG